MSVTNTVPAGLYRRHESNTWFVRFTHEGRQLRFTTGKTELADAILEANKIQANPEAALAGLCRRKAKALEPKVEGLYRRGELWWVRFSSEGKQRFFSTGKTDYNEAVIEADRIRNNAPVECGDLMAEVEKFCAERSANYARDSKYILRRFVSFLDSPDPRAITAEKVQKWVARQEVKPNTREHYRYQIQLFLGYLVKVGKARYNAAKEVVVKTTKRSGRTNWVRKAKVKELLALCSDLELKYILFCGFHAGLRKEEIIMSRESWFDFETGDFGLMHVCFADDWQPKDGRERTVPLSPAFRNFLVNEYLPFRRLALKPGPYMMAPEKRKGEGERYRCEFRTKFENFVKKSGVEFTAHDMRRSFASNLVSGGASLYIVGKLIGDNPETVIESYGHLDPNVDVVAKVFGDGLPVRQDNVINVKFAE